MTEQKSVVPMTRLERYLIETMFDKSLFSDLILIFIHPSFPISLRFNVHKAIVCQSPFLCHQLKSMDPRFGLTERSENTNSLTIDLAKAFTHCGFILAPFQHIIRRKWQKPVYVHTEPSPLKQTDPVSHPLLASHIRFVLQWFYCVNKQAILDTMKDEDNLRILSMSVLLDVDDLTQACVNRYTNKQLSLQSIMRDLETICQLPRGHPAYLQLRDATLLLLFRYGPDNATRLAMLPVDYMADVLSADLLFVTSEFERYCLLKAVLLAFMRSVGKITWTSEGPLDQDAKRLSGYVKPMTQFTRNITANTVRSRKRKRIPSEDLRPDETMPPLLNRLSFSALVPFEKLVADAASGGVIDKATVLSHLLKTTVNYSNMTFDQLTTVRQDGIVQEEIVFRALWQREALERVLFPLSYQPREQIEVEPEEREEEDVEEGEKRSAALDEYFDVDSSDVHEKRRRILLGRPRFRFRSSVYLSPPSVENGWEDESTPEETSVDMSSVFDDGNDSDDSLWVASDGDVSRKRKETNIKQNKKKHMIYRKTFYSGTETILGISYRLQIEAQAMPRYLLQIQDEEKNEQRVEQYYTDFDINETVLVCRFELQRDLKQIAIPPPPVYIKKEKEPNPLNKKQVPNKRVSRLPTPRPVSRVDPPPPQKESGLREITKIHYLIYCLNRHEGILENDQVDPEDRVLVPVTNQREKEHGEPGEMEPGYVGQVLIESDLTKGVTIDTTTALEIFGFPKV